MEITEYKIIQDKKLHPKLKEVQTFEYKKEIVNTYWLVACVFRTLYDLDKCAEEYVYAVAMNYSGDWLGIMNVSHGSQTDSIVDLKPIMTFLLLVGANKFILVHNHPSGNLKISQEDKDITMKLRRIADIAEMEFLEHIIVSRKGYALIIRDQYKYNANEKENAYPFPDY